jgi:serine/threonine protein kinase/tetratricopeptide (TPR) repeat protein
MTPVMVGRYELMHPLGAGGMGEVFLARDRTLDRHVAIKRVNAANAAAARSILHEARIVAALDHPHIAAVFDVVEHGGQPHVVMEYMEGSTLAAQLTKGPFTEGDVITYGRQIADALAYAHARNVVHCDIKPSNVMLTTAGVPKVLDFGIAHRDTPSGKGLETTGHIRGTPVYMAPEVLSGSTPSFQSDVFSLGVLLYELATGRRPYQGRNAVDVALAMTTPAPAVAEIRRGLSSELSAIIARALELDPRKRIQSAEEFKSALSRIAFGTTMTSAIVRESQPTRRGKGVGILVGLTIGCIALVVGLARLPSPIRTTKPAVVGVLMFNNSGNADNEYLASGMTDVLLSDLAGAPGLTVVPRTAMTTLRAESQVHEAVTSLGLTHVITGGIQQSGAFLRITVNLVSDRAKTLKWSATFDGAVSDALHFEQRVSNAVLRTMVREGLISSNTVTQARETPPTTNADAFDDYAHGRALIERSDVPGNVDRAAAFFERAVARDPSFARAHAAIGEVMYRRYRTSRDPMFIDRARAAMLSALRLDSDDVAVAYTMAVIDFETGKADDAISTLNAIIAKHEANDDAHRLLGRIYSSRGNFDFAINELREARAIRPEYPATIRDLGLAYYDKGLFEEAIAEFTKLTSLQPDNAAAFQTLGTAYHAANQLDRALASYRQANTLGPRATTYSNIGTIHYGRGEFLNAIGAYRQAIALQPNEAATHRNLADTLLLNGDTREARLEYERAIELAAAYLKVNPSATRSRSMIAYCQAKLGRFEEARRNIEAAGRAAPGDNDIAYKKAVIEAIAGDPQAAIKSLERALALGYSRAIARTDRDLSKLKSLPAFRALVGD